VRSGLAATVLCVAALAGVVAGCGSGGVNPERDSAKVGDASRGAVLFMNGKDGQPACAFCHRLDAAGALGPFGPSLDSEGREYESVHLSDRAIRKVVLDFVGNGRCPGGQENNASRCMPKNLVKGQDAIDVATYVARCAAKRGRPGCRPDDVMTASRPKARAGLRLYRSLSCTACHSTNGNVAVAPSFKGLAGSRVKLTGGQTVAADDAYLIESTINHDRQIVDGYRAGVVGRFVPPGSVSRAQAQAIVDFIKTLK